MRNYIIIAVICLGIISCSKDKFTTTPQLKYISVNTTKLIPNQLIEFKLSYTDAEGDLEDSVFILKVEKNCPASNLKLKYPFPKVSGSTTRSGDLLITFANGSNVPGYEAFSVAPKCNFNDTCFFRFVLRDKAKHTSDTVNSGQIIIIK